MLKFGGQEYHYERSFPVKGHGASLPNFLREQLAAGKKPAAGRAHGAASTSTWS